MKENLQNIKSKNFKLTNLKFLLFSISFRRNFIPLLSIYFLTLPNTTVNEIGIFTGIGFIATILFEVPSGYLSDHIGHKYSLIISKIFQILSIFCYIIGFYLVSPYNFYIFIIAAIFQTIGFTFFSGTRSAFYHEILEEAGKEKQFAKYEGKLGANTSLASVLLIFLLPFTVAYHILLPFIIWIFVDILGTLILISIPNPQIKIEDKNNKTKKSFINLISEAYKDGLLNLSVFLGLISGFLLGVSAFRTPYLEGLGYPVILIGSVMGFSRIVWYIVGHNIHKIEKYVSMKQHFFIEIFLFSMYFILIAYFNNPYLVGFIISILIGYKWGRGSLVRSYIFKDYIKDKRYKATFLSISSMLNSVFGTIISFTLGYSISLYGYKLNYHYLGVILFVLLSISYYFAFIRNKRI